MLAERISNRAEGGDLAQVALDWLAHDVRPRMIVSTALHVHWRNQLALECLASQPFIHVRGDELVCMTAAIQKSVLDFVLRVGDEVQTLALFGPSRRDVLLLRGWGLPHSHGQLACIEFGRDHDAFSCDYRDLKTVFGLTQAEHRIVLEMLGGKTVTTIAGEFGLSVGTVRTHVKRLYSKIEVASREELLGRLAPYRVV